jgi:hypothetical protein
MMHEAALAEIESLRSRAGFFRKQRRSDGELYHLLAQCLAMCEQCDRDPGLLDALKEAHLASLEGRRYFETGADAPLVVGRMVFGGGHGREAAWRYTACMREAQKRQIASGDLPGWLMEHGGLNALFLGRPVKSRTAATKILHLSSRIRVPKDENFTVTLRRTERGHFDVISIIGGEIE